MEADNQLTQADPSADAPEAAISISIEWLAYLALAGVALLLRAAALDAVPLSDDEARQALHAWHTISGDAPGAFAVSSSPLTYLTQLLTFSTLGAGEFSARIGSVIAGLLLSFSPLLFRQSLGRTRSFVWAILLSLLTVPVASSRLADGTTWMMLFTALAIWMIRRYWYSNQLSDALWASVFVTGMLLLSSPAGIPLLLILLAAGWLAVWRTALSAPQRLHLPGDDILQSSLRRLKAFPFAKVAFVPVAVTLMTATAFMLNPGGLATVSQLINSALTGFTQPATADGARLAFIALLTYEPLLIIFALGGAWLLWKHGDVTYIDRFAAAWALLAGLGLILYADAKAADAMWAVVPLTLLASYGITELMVNRLVAALWANPADSALYSTRYWWVKWLISLGALLFLFVLAVQFLQAARGLLTAPLEMGLSDAASLLGTHVQLAQSLGLLVMTVVIMLIVYLLVVNSWGNGTTLQGVGLGFALFMLLSGLGGAWQAAVSQADNPAEPWHHRAIAKDADLLRETLFELADRSTQGFPMLKFSVVTDLDGVLGDDGLAAWLARDFPQARFASSVREAAGDPIILMAQGDNQPELGGDYIGQRFVLRRGWSLGQLGFWDWPAWWSHRRLRSDWHREEAAILWLRQDVYDGILTDEEPPQ